MNTDNLLKSLNMTEGEVLTLEKAKDRMEFAALPMMGMVNPGEATSCSGYMDQDDPNPDDDHGDR